MSKNDDKFEFSLSNHYLTTGSPFLNEPHEENVQNIFPFIDPLTEFAHDAENTLIDEEKSINSLFADSNFSNPVLYEDEVMVHGITDKTNISESKLLDHFDIIPGEISTSNFFVNPPKPIPSVEPITKNNTKLQIINPKIIKNEDEILSSPQILSKTSSKNVDYLNHFLFTLKCSPPLPPPDSLLKNLNLFKKQNDTKKKRKNFTKEQKKVLIDFIEQHKDNPYIDSSGIVKISRQTGLSNKQIRIFLTNYRVRNDCAQKRNRRALYRF